MNILSFDRLGEFSRTGAAGRAINEVRTRESENGAPVMISIFPDMGEGLPTKGDAERDVDVMLASLGLQLIRRYMDQRHWHEESELARAADEAEPGLKLENVAAHSWHVADAIMLLAPNFPEVDASRALELAVLHDKLELFTGDYDPVGQSGDGTDTHVFNAQAQAAKTAAELAALDHYLTQLRAPIRDWQRELILETIHATSPEARFVKAVDKLQALTFVLAKKAGAMTDEHLFFSLRYSSQGVQYFPKLTVHHLVLVRRLLRMVAEYRRVSPADIVTILPDSVRPIAAAAEA